MKQVKLGKNITVKAIGMGCMGLSHGYGAATPFDEGVKFLQAAHAYGYNFFDTAESYGHGENEKMVGQAFKNCRSEVVISTKFHLDGSGYSQKELDKVIEEHLTASLKRLGGDYVDLYFLLEAIIVGEAQNKITFSS